MTETPAFRVGGEVKDRDHDADLIQLWGTVQPKSSDDMNTAGVLLQEGNVVVRNPDKNANLAIGGTYSGDAYFVERRTGKNGFGVEVPIFVYDTTPPLRIQTLRSAVDDEAKQLAALNDSLNDILRPDRDAFAHFVSDSEKLVMDQQSHVHFDSTSVTTHVISRTTFITYLDALAKAQAEWKGEIDQLDHVAAALMTPERTTQLPRWITDFSDLAERWGKVETAQAAYRKDRDAVLASDLSGAIAFHRKAVAELPDVVASAADLAKVTAGLRTIQAEATKATFDSSPITPAYTAWRKAAEEAFASNPKWLTATERDVTDAEATLSSIDPEGITSGEYAKIVTQFEDGLDERQVATIPDRLATTSPWSATRDLGLTEEVRAYHRALILRFDANVKSSEILAMKAVIAKEVQKHPEMWSLGNVMAIYSGLQKSQFAAYLNQKIQGEVASDDDVKMIDSICCGASMLSASDLLSSTDVTSFLEIVDHQENPTASRSALALDVVAVIGGASFDVVHAWHHGKLLIAANKNAKAGDILNIDAMVEKDTAAYPDMWNDDARKLWESIQDQEFLAYSQASNLYSNDNGPHVAPRARLTPDRNFSIKDICERDLESGSDSGIKEWTRICSKFTVDEAKALKVLFAKESIQTAVNRSFGLADTSKQAYFDPNLWDAIIKYSRP